MFVEFRQYCCLITFHCCFAEEFDYNDFISGLVRFVYGACEVYINQLSNRSAHQLGPFFLSIALTFLPNGTRRRVRVDIAFERHWNAFPDWKTEARFPADCEGRTICNINQIGCHG